MGREIGEERSDGSVKVALKITHGLKQVGKAVAC